MADGVDIEMPPVHPLVAKLIGALTELSTIQPSELSEGDIAAALGAILSTQTVMYLELSTRGFLINLIPLRPGEDMPTKEELENAMQTLLGNQT